MAALRKILSDPATFFSLFFRLFSYFCPFLGHETVQTRQYVMLETSVPRVRRTILRGMEDAPRRRCIFHRMMRINEGPKCTAHGGTSIMQRLGDGSLAAGLSGSQ